MRPLPPTKALALALLTLAPPSTAIPSAEYIHLLFTSSWGTFPSGWTIDQGHSYHGGPSNWGTGEIQSYTSSPSNIAINTAGNLVITPQLDPATGVWTSARIETTPEHDFACPPGGKLWVEGRIRLGDNPSARSMGIWPAFWMLGSAYRGDLWNWPSVGEIDVLESANGYEEVWHGVHCDTSPGGGCNEPNGIGGSGVAERGQWHVIVLEMDRSVEGGWRKESLRFKVDGVLRHEVTGEMVGTEQAWRPLVESQKFLLLNVAVGGGFPNGVGGANTPDGDTVGGEGASMEVEYVHVYSTAEG